MAFVFLEEQMANQIGDSQRNLPNFNFDRQLFPNKNSCIKTNDAFASVPL